MTLTDLLREEWERRPDATSGEIAAAVMTSARTRADLFELALPAVVAAATVAKRQQVRSVEAAAFGQKVPEVHTPGVGQTASTDPLAARKALMSDRAYVNHDLGYVAWGDMTAEMHTLRADYLERKAHGHLVTADRHRTAAKFIEEAGVSCLNDLPSLPDELFEGVAA